MTEYTNNTPYPKYNVKDIEQNFYNISFDTKKSAENFISYYESSIAQINKVIDLDWDFIPEEGRTECKEYHYKKLKTLMDKWLSCKGRMISSAITGGGNFPVARAQKAMEAEHNAHGAIIHYLDEDLERMTTKHFKYKYAEFMAKREQALKDIKNFAFLDNFLTDAERLVRQYKTIVEEGAESLKEEGKFSPVARAGREIRADLKVMFCKLTDLKPELFNNYLDIITRIDSKVEGSTVITKTQLNTYNKYFDEIELRAKQAERHEEWKAERKQARTERLQTEGEEIKGELVKHYATRDVTKVCLNGGYVDVYYEGKPDTATRSYLKSNGFRWNGKKLCWYASNDKQDLIITEDK